MHADSCFFIGSTHTVCEDYALSGLTKDNQVFAAVSDGCSGSDHTDFGARFLCHAAQRQANEYGDFNSERVLWEAAGMARQTALHPGCLDATLLFAMENPDARVIEVWKLGDGVIAAKRRDGGIEVYSTQFKHGMPAYPAYRLNDARLRGYLKLSEDAARVVRSWKTAPDYEGPPVTNEQPQAGMAAGYLKFPISTYELVLLMSDGAETFQAKERGAPKSIALLEVVNHLLAVKGYAGEFMHRRAGAFLKKHCAREGWQHADDLSIAAIHCGDEG